MQPGYGGRVVHVSGFQRLCHSIMCAVCGAPIFAMMAMFLLGWNEKRAVCDWNKLGQAYNKAIQVGCDGDIAHQGEGGALYEREHQQRVVDSWEQHPLAVGGNWTATTLTGRRLRAGRRSAEARMRASPLQPSLFEATDPGRLLIFSCKMKKEGLQRLSFKDSDFSNFQYQGTGLAISSEKRQCVQRRHERKDSVGGGKTFYYSYTQEWRSSEVDDSQFSGDNWNINCGVKNGQWDSGVPSSRTKYAAQVNVGSYTLFQGGLLEQIPVETSVPLNDSMIPLDWEKRGNHLFKGKPGIGQYRVSFKGNNWDNPMLTVLGQDSGDGHIWKWTSADTWLCTGSNLGVAREGRLSRDLLFTQLRAESHGLTVLLRFVGWVIFWIAFALLFGPLEVAADFIPLVGPIMGDALASITCCISCVPATGCTLLVISIAWVAMRPVLGAGLLLSSCCFFSLAVGSKRHYQSQRPPAVDPTIEQA